MQIPKRNMFYIKQFVFLKLLFCDLFVICDFFSCTQKFELQKIGGNFIL